MFATKQRVAQLVTGIALLATSAASFAEVSWDSVKRRVADAHDYKVIYKYDGPKGNFKFDYRTVVPGKIRAEILDSRTDSSKVGSVVVYDTGWNSDKVRAKTGGATVVRNTTHKDVVGTAFVTPVLSLILEQTRGAGSPTVTAEGNGRTRFDFKAPGGRYSVWANVNSDIVRSERTTEEHAKEIREFSSFKYNVNPDCSL